MKINKKYLITGLKASAITYGRTNTKKFITIHGTDNESPGADANAHARLQYNGNSRQASWHYTVDDKGAYQSFDHSYACWHAGNANRQSIAIEICVNKGADYNKAIQNAVELTKLIMKQEGIPASRVVQHNYWTGKHCPRTIREGKMGWDWAKFKAALSKNTPTASPNKYKVVAGDTLFNIANRHNTTVSELKRINGLKNDVIKVGQVLSLKGTTVTNNPTYYKRSLVGRQIVSKTSIGLYTDKNLKAGTEVMRYPKNEVFTLVDFYENPNGATRFKVKSGYWISGNKNYIRLR